jgi:long-subunit acyl-CoA synthetase (AMP-forming)
MTITVQVSQGLLGGRVRPMPGSVGILWPSLEGRIVREDGSEAEVNEPGEFLLRGRNVALGYWKDEKATRETFTADGWLKTGDRMRVDEWGNLLCVLSSFDAIGDCDKLICWTG